MTRRKILTAFFLVAVLVTLCRETGLFDFNYFRATTNHKLQTDWKDSSVCITLEKSLFHTAFVNRRFSDLPVVVLYESDTLLHSQGNGPAFVLTIGDIQAGTLWTPLYKRASYQAVVRSSFQTEMLKINGNSLMHIRPNINGRHLATGQTTIVGVSSHRNSVNILKMLIAADVLQAAKEYLASLDGSTAYNSGLASVGLDE